MKKVVIILAVVIVVLLGILFFYNPAHGPTIQDPGALQGAISPDGNVAVFSPLVGALIASPVSIQGTVVNGGWFNEATFPVKVLDGNGAVIGHGVAQAEGLPGSWMSTGTVPFTANVTFTVPTYATGTIVLAKDNPSGNASSAEAFSIPVKFK